MQDFFLYCFFSFLPEGIKTHHWNARQDNPLWACLVIYWGFSIYGSSSLCSLLCQLDETNDTRFAIDLLRFPRRNTSWRKDTTTVRHSVLFIIPIQNSSISERTICGQRDKEYMYTASYAEHKNGRSTDYWAGCPLFHGWIGNIASDVLQRFTKTATLELR